MTGVLAAPEWRLLTALAIGLLVGAERQRRSIDDHPELAAGIRTHALIALLGGLSALLGSLPITIASSALVAGGILIGYLRTSAEKPGQTSEIAAMATFALGFLAMSSPGAATAAGLAMTVLLAARAPLHEFVTRALTRRDMLDGLIFLVAAFVILPLVPDRTVDRWGLVNPYVLWRLAVVLMGLSALGYIAQRVLGARFGLLVAGFIGGFVSTTVAIAAMGGRSRSDKALVAPAAAGATAALLGCLVYLFALVAAADAGLLLRLLPAFAGAALPTLLLTAILGWRPVDAGTVAAPAGRAFDARLAILFAGLVAVFAVVGKLLQLWLGSGGVLAGAIATGFIDLHATAVSVSALHASGTLATAFAVPAVLAALTANMSVKVPTAFATGTRGYGARVSLGLALLVAGAWAGEAAFLWWPR